MKTRYGFVSNSSSASFVIKKRWLPAEMIDAINKHWEYAHQHHFKCIDNSYITETDKWHIKETETEISGFTFMDNFGMQQFLLELFAQFQIPTFEFNDQDYSVMFLDDDTNDTKNNEKKVENNP
jgi:hypothetical protein